MVFDMTRSSRSRVNGQRPQRPNHLRRTQHEQQGPSIQSQFTSTTRHSATQAQVLAQPAYQSPQIHTMPPPSRCQHNPTRSACVQATATLECMAQHIIRRGTHVRTTALSPVEDLTRTTPVAYDVKDQATAPTYVRSNAPLWNTQHTQRSDTAPPPSRLASLPCYLCMQG